MSMTRRMDWWERAFTAWQGAYRNGTATPTQIDEIADWLLATYEVQQKPFCTDCVSISPTHAWTPQTTCAPRPR